MIDLFTPPYFNTVGETGSTLAEYVQAAEKQNEVAMRAIWVHGRLSPSGLVAYFPEGTPLTSIRRSLTVLTKRGLLVKTGEKVVGAFGRKEHVWKLAE